MTLNRFIAALPGAEGVRVDSVSAAHAWLGALKGGRIGRPTERRLETLRMELDATTRAIEGEFGPSSATEEPDEDVHVPPIP